MQNSMLNVAIPQLSAQNIHLSYGPQTALRGASGQIGPGWTAIVGPNGAGKSTLLKVLAGLLTPQTGQVTLNGQDLSTLALHQRAQHIAWLSQHQAFSAELTVRQCVALGRLPQQGLFANLTTEDEHQIDQAMQATAVQAWAHRLLGELSGGERQRVLLARALAVQAPITLLDEPTTHLDPIHQVALVKLLHTWRAQGRCVVSVLHDVSLALQADELMVMQAGQVVAQGASTAPTLHRALEAAFDHALRIQRIGEQWCALPNIE